MKKGRFTTEQIIGVLKQHEAGRKVQELAREMGRLVESQLYDVKPTDPATILAATLVLFSTALVSALIPAHRASTVIPDDALRFE